MAHSKVALRANRRPASHKGVSAFTGDPPPVRVQGGGENETPLRQGGGKRKFKPPLLQGGGKRNYLATGRGNEPPLLQGGARRNPFAKAGKTEPPCYRAREKETPFLEGGGK